MPRLFLPSQWPPQSDHKLPEPSHELHLRHRQSDDPDCRLANGTITRQYGRLNRVAQGVRKAGSTTRTMRTAAVRRSQISREIPVRRVLERTSTVVARFRLKEATRWLRFRLKAEATRWLRFRLKAEATRSLQCRLKAEATTIAAVPPEGGSYTVAAVPPEGGSYTIAAVPPEGGSHTMAAVPPEGGSYGIDIDRIRGPRAAASREPRPAPRTPRRRAPLPATRAPHIEPRAPHPAARAPRPAPRAPRPAPRARGCYSPAA